MLVSLARARLGKKQPGRKGNLPPLDLCGYPLWFVYECFMRWVNSDYVALADTGGVADQDELLWQAMQNMLPYYNAAVNQVSSDSS